MNVVLLTVDSLRADFLSEADTPTIDSLMRSGINCTKTFSAAPYTTASCPAILSGTYPWSYGGYPGISPSRPYLPDMLQDAGYRTGVFHSNPYLDAAYGYDRGVDEFVDSESFSTPLSRARQYLSERLSEESMVYSVLRRLSTILERFTGDKIGLPYATAAELNEVVLKWLESMSNPQFTWLHYMDVHNPYIPHEGIEGSDISAEEAVDLHNRMIEQPATLSERDMARLKSLYVGEIEYLDQQIGDLLSEIKDEDTLVIFTSDHGEGFCEHGFFSHLEDEFYDELVHVPLVIDPPADLTKTVSAPTSTVDIVPTILDFVGNSPPDGCAGESVVRSVDRDWVFGHAGERSDGTVMTTDGHWKLVRRTPSGDEQLLERTEDGEHDRAVRRHRERVGSLQSAIDSHLEFIDTTQESTFDPASVSATAQERLEKLGYVE